MDRGMPRTFGVLTTTSAEEALARVGAGASNKGWEAAEAALTMTRLFRQLTGPVDLEPGG